MKAQCDDFTHVYACVFEETQFSALDSIKLRVIIFWRHIDDMLIKIKMYHLETFAFYIVYKSY